MDIIKKKSWSTFRDWLKGYFHEAPRRRQQLLFRGLRDSRWKLLTTLDLRYPFDHDEERKQFAAELIEAFRRELMHVEPGGTDDLKGVAMELLARHQGLPSPLMDWTESPYIAAYFAFASCTERDKQLAAIWMMDRAKLKEAPNVEIIDDYSLLQFNQRALRQRGVFVRLATCEALEDLVGGALTQLQIPARQCRAALSELDEMTINPTYLFPDLVGAARTAEFRVVSRRNG